jgi:hypothetical protein
MSEFSSVGLVALKSRLGDLTNDSDDVWSGPELKALCMEYYQSHLNDDDTFSNSKDPVGEVLCDFMYWLLGDSETPGYNARTRRRY